MIDIEHLENRKDFTHYDYHKYNKANGYGLSNRQLKQWILRHKDGTPKQREWIENMLTDINFHYECGLICNGKYDEILRDL